MSRNNISADEAAAAAVQNLTDYQPPRAALSRESVAASLEAMRRARQAELDAQGALATARDRHVAAVWSLHNLVIEVRAAVAAQYGVSSDELQLLGIKKKSERKAPVRRKTTTAA
jgi:hypothetical protein